MQLKYLQQQQQKQQKEQQHQTNERGDPDGGCNLDDLSTNYLSKTSELRVNLPAPSLSVQQPPPTTTVRATTNLINRTTNIKTSTSTSTTPTKKGWLMKQDNRTGDWTKHWFTLNGAALFYYRDAISEERGVLDGVLDVNSITEVTLDVTANRGYAFTLITWDKRRLTLTSLSPNSRNSWMASLKSAAGIQTSGANNQITTNTNMVTVNDSKQQYSEETKEELHDIEKDFIKAQRTHDTGSPLPASPLKCKIGMDNTLLSPLTPPTSKTHLSSDEEYRTASEGGRRDSIDWGSPVSPSPPILNMLRVKDRVRARTTNCPRLHKRSRSSPPTSRRSTMDSVGSDELPTSPIITTVQEELNIDKELHFRLRVAEKESDLLRDEAKQQELRIAELLNTLERTEQELSARIQEMEDVRNNLSRQLEEANRNTDKLVSGLTEELSTSQQKIKQLEDRLMRGIDENEILYKRLRELEGCSPSSFSNLKSVSSTKLKRLDSLSDLTQIKDIDPYFLERNALADEYNELRTRFEKAVNEIRAMKRELKESQNQYDTLEISYASLKQDLECKNLEDRAQLQMMAARIQDLTLKYSSSERQVRTLKQKLAKSDRRRSLSLRGGSAKEPLSLSKEFELKVCELEGKIDELEKQTPIPTPIPTPTTTPTASSSCSNILKTRVKKSTRRRSLESSVSAESLQLMVRVNDLEKRVESANNTPSTCSTAENSNPKLSEHLIERLRCLEGVLITSKNRLEQNLQQLQNLRNPRNRRSMSPITSDRKDSYRYIERCLVDVHKLLRESCETCLIGGSSAASQNSDLILLPESSPIKLALTQLETQLSNKLSELLKQRRVLRENNALTKNKQLELLAGRIALESIIFGKLRDSFSRAQSYSKADYGKGQLNAEVSETAHLMRMLKAKLSGKSVLNPKCSTDVLAGVLTRRLLLSSKCVDTKVPKSTKPTKLVINTQILENLLQQQNELNVIMKRYKMNALESLASGLAAETLSYISGNDMVQGAIQEAWRQAQETVNAELVQAEIMHVMMRHAERYEHAINPALGYTLTAEQCISFEKFADAVHDSLRKEMEIAAMQLTNCYDTALERLKSGQWHMMNAEEERKSSEARLLLSEFADIIGHKALIDARIHVLSGRESAVNMVTGTEQPSLAKPFTNLFKYEELFEDLICEFQINNAADILAEADFEFMYKHKTMEILEENSTQANNTILSDISSFLAQLEDSLIALQCQLGSTQCEIRSKNPIDKLEDVSQKCCDLRQRSDEILQEVHRKLNLPCKYCQQIRDEFQTRQNQHESELMHIKHEQTKELNVLLQEVENHRQSLKSMENEKININSNMLESQQLIRQSESDLLKIRQQLKSKECEMQRQQQEHRELSVHLRLREQHLREETDALTIKCVQQDENYAALLQERDSLKSELLKEKERRQLFEKRLEMLELEHTKQLECLQEAYRDQLLSQCNDFPSNVSDEESFRQRYQMEIEQLRTLCEKGLSAMESSHRRIISDLKETHMQEIERLLLEKETALAEETQATLAALDAMRKAHQSEVQREVARFKQEFFKQIQRGEKYTLDSAKAKE